MLQEERDRSQQDRGPDSPQIGAVLVGLQPPTPFYFFSRSDPFLLQSRCLFVCTRWQLSFLVGVMGGGG